MVPSLEKRLLHEIVGPLAVAAKRYREGAQIADLGHESFLEAR